ncbi:MAG: DegT/DnrJ/EryC1/StrS family aminotransferase [Spirochaetes bacterium]|nr:DegT/DnrJ/EryC1/StrS family aminotransferase [Spirochaetota bacterium]
MQIPFHRPYMTDDEVQAASRAILNGWLTMGEISFKFENDFRQKVGSSHAVAVNSCTAALHLALCAINLEADDEVIIPADTFTATGEVITYFKAKPVIADIEKDTHNISIKSIEEKITPRTRAIIPVHFSGQPCDMDEIMSIAEKHKLKVIEDAAHAFPARYKNRNVGTIGDITAFSFYATKTITAGEGGMITTENEEWAQRMKMLRLHGISKDAWKRYSAEGTYVYDVIEPGFKYNPTDISSAIASVQLSKSDEMNDRRLQITQRYIEAFRNNDAFIPYVVKPDRETCWHLYPLRLNPEALSISRDEFMIKLKQKGIVTSVHFIPLYRFTWYKNQGWDAADFANSEWVFEREISLPIYPSLTDEEVDYVIENVIEIAAQNLRIGSPAR